MAKAALTEGAVKSLVKATTTAKKPAPPPPAKKAVTKKAVTKKVTPVSSAVFTEETAAPKKAVAKKVVETPALSAKTKAVSKTAKGVEPVLVVPSVTADEKDASLFIAATSKKSIATNDDIIWAKLFNAYLRRDLKQATTVVATLATLVKK